MTYEFTTSKVGMLKLNDFHGTSGNTFIIHGVNAQISDANVIIGGLNQLLGIVNFQNQYEPENTVRVVNENVVQQD